MGLKPICTESVAHFSHRVRHLRLNRMDSGVTRSETKWLGGATRHRNKGSVKPGVGGAGDGFFVGAEFHTVLARFFCLQVFLAASVLRSTLAFAGLSRGHCVQVNTSSQSA